MSKYTWIITSDKALGDTSDAVGKIGPSGARDRMRFDIVIQQGAHFRLLKADGTAEFSGYILGDYAGPEPLRDYGYDNGCASIEYERDGIWVSLDGRAREA